MVSDPQVTVVIPTHNRAGGLLQRAVSSVLNQTVQDLEVLVVDDGSSDGTQEYLSTHSDPRVRYIRHDSPKGGCAARNAGVMSVNTAYVAFLDDDDTWVPGKLQGQLKALEQSGADYAYAGWRWIDEKSGLVTRERVPDAFGKVGGRPRWFFNFVNDLVLKTDLAREYPWDEDPLLNYHHTDLLIRLSGVARAVWTDEVVTECLSHSGPRSSDSMRGTADGIEKVLTSHDEFFSRHPRERSLYHVRIGAYRLGLEHRLSGVTHFYSAFVVAPSPSVLKHAGAALARYGISRARNIVRRP